MNAPHALIVMGVSGSGKTTFGMALAKRESMAFRDGDDFHSAANVAKMRAGRPLDDDDRAGWLQAIGATLAQHVASGRSCIVACSALKARYRQMLRSLVPSLRVIHLNLTRALATERVSGRTGHYMPASLVDSQFTALEAPHGEPHTLILDAALPVDALTERARAWLHADDPSLGS